MSNIIHLNTSEKPEIPGVMQISGPSW